MVMPRSAAMISTPLTCTVMHMFMAPLRSKRIQIFTAMHMFTEMPRSTGKLESYGNAEVYGKEGPDDYYDDMRIRIGGRLIEVTGARVYGDAKVYGNAKVYQNAEVFGKAHVSGEAESLRHS